MSWSIGMMIVFGSFVLIYLVGEIFDRFGPLDDVDYVADSKRRVSRAARKLSGEFREPRA